MSSTAVLPTGKHIIDWYNLDHEFAGDGLGRTFKWSDLKGKTIFLCGHGQHTLKDGYVTVPPATSINFYQTYGMCLNAISVPDIIAGLEDHWLQPERTFRAGQSCPNMTLFEDDRHLLPTDQALQTRLKSIPAAAKDAFILNANQFSGLKSERSSLESCSTN
jgi:hypothetical protein